MNVEVIGIRLVSFLEKVMGVIVFLLLWFLGFVICIRIIKSIDIEFVREKIFQFCMLCKEFWEKGIGEWLMINL